MSKVVGLVFKDSSKTASAGKPAKTKEKSSDKNSNTSLIKDESTLEDK